MNKRIIIANKFRFIIFMTCLILLLLTTTSIILNTNKVFSTTYQEYKTIVVDKGDTLWEIASNNNPKEEDVRKVIYELKVVNNLKSAYIRPGDILKIPKK
ncbi:MAG: LysM peptidoglycan-binding domain-containing protein [Firmicutes bacterium]|nr:LysM peptidoglycan-binding domain-containing protein [Bacillota bacterium]